MTDTKIDELKQTYFDNLDFISYILKLLIDGKSKDALSLLVPGHDPNLLNKLYVYYKAKVTKLLS